jgi:hypothetical protein
MVPLKTVDETCVAPNPAYNCTYEQAKAFQLYLSLLGGMTVGNLALNPTVSGPTVAEFILPGDVDPALPQDKPYYFQLKYGNLPQEAMDPAFAEGYHCVNACLNVIRNYGVINGTIQLYTEARTTCPKMADEILEAFRDSGLEAWI